VYFLISAPIASPPRGIGSRPVDLEQRVHDGFGVGHRQHLIGNEETGPDAPVGLDLADEH